jgi:hypothetical protein
MTSVRCSVSPTVQHSGTSTLGFTVASVRRYRRHHQPCPPHTLPNKTRRHYRTPAASPEDSHPAACHTGCLCRTDVPRPSRPASPSTDDGIRALGTATASHPLRALCSERDRAVRPPEPAFQTAPNTPAVTSPTPHHTTPHIARPHNSHAESLPDSDYIKNILHRGSTTRKRKLSYRSQCPTQVISTDARSSSRG